MIENILIVIGGILLIAGNVLIDRWLTRKYGLWASLTYSLTALVLIAITLTWIISEHP